MMADVSNPATLAEHADAIRGLGKRVVGDIIEIGRRLSECKRICGHGNWLPWLDREFGWTEMTATRYINVYELSKSNNLLDLDVPLSGLYLLAAPSTPEEARDEIVTRAKAGERISVTETKRVVEHSRARNPLAPRDDIGPQSAGETARKDARIEELQTEKRRLEMENASLQARNERLEREVLLAHSGIATPEGLFVQIRSQAAILPLEELQEFIRCLKAAVALLEDGIPPPLLRDGLDLHRTEICDINDEAMA